MQRLFVLVLALGLFLPAAAFAHTTDVEVDFDVLTLGSYDGELSLEYTISSRSWRQLQRHDVTPRIDIYTAGHDCDGDPVYEDVELYDRSDVLILDHRDFRHATDVRVAFSRHTYRHSRSTIRLTGSLTSTVGLSVEQKSRHERSDRSRSDRSRSDRSRSDRSRSDRSRSDRSHRDRSRRHRSRSDRSSSGSSRCHGHRSHSDSSCDSRSDRRHEHNSRLQSRIVDACSDNTSFNSDQQQCVQRAAHLTASDVIVVIEACGEQTSFSADFHTCMQTAAGFRAAPAPSIHACGEATSFGSDFASCLTAASRYDHEPSAVIRSCGNSTSLSSTVPQCVDDARF